ncbi:MAG TPA: methyltransferase domain-containing protein [Caulobacteraceae bacterium]|jgi:SAM-dependent methyltransferase
MQPNVALRDMVRSSFVGPFIRDFVVIPYRRRQWRDDVRRRSASDHARFQCNLCGYEGLFAGIAKGEGAGRSYAVCPNCGSCERHRLQLKVLDQILREFEPSRKSILHFAPERFFKRRFKNTFGIYKTADLFRADVDIKADITNMRLPDESYDVVYASHVLEHVPDDRKAVAEIYRILKPGGMAILPVPINSMGKTEEYAAPRPEEDGHIRSPGLADYFDRYRDIFDEVKIFSSPDFDDGGPDNQVYIRVRTPDGENRIPDFVPVCFKRPVDGRSSAFAGAPTPGEPQLG